MKDEAMTPRHEKGHPTLGMTAGQKALAALIGLLAVADTPVFFIVMFTSVNGLLGPFFDGWAWTVPVATEISFTVLYLLELLLEWRDRPARLLRLAPFLFAGASLWLNVYAAHGSLPAAVGHGVITAAFFIPAVVIKAAVRRLLVSPAQRAQEVALVDARAHARDVLRSSLGPLWRWRCPVLLRRQLRSGRLPAAVLEAVATGSAAAWEPAVEGWIAAAVALPERFSASLAAARAEASAAPPQPPAEALPEVPPAPSAAPPREVPASPPEDSAAPRPEGPARPIRRPSRLVPARASDDDLAELLRPRLAAGVDLSATGAIKIIRDATGGKSSIGHDRAKQVLAVARDQASRVVQLGERRQA
jgi:hypothetical protein